MQILNPQTSRRLINALKWVAWEFSGLRLMWEKIKPPKPQPGGRPPSSFFLWALAIYAVLFGAASARYENTVDRIENRANALFTQLSAPAYKKVLGRIPAAQNMPCPAKPQILWPPSVIRSLFGRERPYDAIVETLKQTVEAWKDKLGRVNLSLAHLRGADLVKADLTKANLAGADLSWATLAGARLEKAILLGTNLKGADLQKVNLREAILEVAILSKANLKKANLTGANLQGAFLDGANMQGTILGRAILLRADLKGANLRGVDLSGAIGLTREQLQSTVIDEKTRLPDYLLRPKKGGKSGGW